MMIRAAIAFVALGASAFAQHGGAHAGSFGGRGSAGHSGASGFSRSGSFARPESPVRGGAFGGSSRLRGMGLPNFTSRRIPAYGNRFMTPRPTYRSIGAGPSRSGGREGDRDHRDRFDARRRSFENWYVNNYPAWLGYGYPYLTDPGFNDSGDSDNSVYNESGAALNYPAPSSDYGAPTPTGAQNGLRAAEVPSPPSSPLPEQTLTVIFKNGRAPIEMHNYMMNTEVLTDLDSRHHEQISMDQIDVAATQRVNWAAGVGFEIPVVTRD